MIGIHSTLALAYDRLSSKGFAFSPDCDPLFGVVCKVSGIDAFVHWQAPLPKGMRFSQFWHGEDDIELWIGRFHFCASREVPLWKRRPRVRRTARDRLASWALIASDTCLRAAARPFGFDTYLEWEPPFPEGTRFFETRSRGQGFELWAGRLHLCVSKLRRAPRSCLA